MDKRTWKIFISIILVHVIFFIAVIYIARSKEDTIVTIDSELPHYGSKDKPDPKLCIHPDGIDLSHWNEAYD